MNKKPNILLMLAIAIFATAVVFKIAEADDGHGHHHDDNGDTIVENVLTGGDVSTGDLSTRGFSVGGSDMEIADSLATHSILFGLWQGTHTNPYAEADKAEARGNHQAAAEMRCSTKKYQKVYGKGQVCIDAVIYIEPTEITAQTPQDDARIEALYVRITGLEAERIQDKANAEKMAKRANARAVRAERRAVSQYGITDEQRQELAEVFKQ